METENKIYFGHPIDIYNTEKEKDLIEDIKKGFPEYVVENPNQPHHAEGYKIWKEKTGYGMDYFFKEVLPKMEAGIFLPFEDGKWGAGVYGEAEFLYERGKPIYEIDLEGRIKEMDLDMSRVLSIEETRARVYKSPKPL